MFRFIVILICFIPAFGLSSAKKPLLPESPLAVQIESERQILQTLPDHLAADLRTIGASLTQIIQTVTPPTTNRNVSVDAELFLRALADGQNPEILRALAERVAPDPAHQLEVLAKIIELKEAGHVQTEMMILAAERLKKFASAHRPPLPPIGSRLLNSGLFVLSAVSFVYSFQSAFAPDVPWAFADMARITGQFSLFHLAINVLAEWKVLKSAIPVYLEARRNKRSTIQLLAELPTLLKLVSSEAMSPELRSLLNRWRTQRVPLREITQTSIEATKQSLEALAESEKQLQSLLVRERAMEFHQIVLNLSSQLTETERQEIRRSLEAGRDLPDWLKGDTRILLYESDIQEFLKKNGLWNERDTLSQLYKLVVAKQDQSRFQYLENTTVHKLTNLANISLGVGITVMGFVASIGAVASPLDAGFIPEAIHWIRNHSVQLLQISGLFTIPSIAAFYWKLGAYMKGDIQLRRLGTPERLEALAGLLRMRLEQISVSGEVSTTSRILAERALEAVLDSKFSTAQNQAGMDLFAGFPTCKSLFARPISN